MRLALCSMVCAVSVLTACDAPLPRQTGPVSISAQDLFIVRQGQLASAKMLAANCPRYGYSIDRETAVTAQTIAQIEARQSTAETRRQLNILRNQLPVDTSRYVAFYRQSNNLERQARVAEYCRVADRERSKGGTIGQLLVPGGQV